MKYIILSLALLIMSCRGYDKSNYFTQEMQFDITDIQDGLPDGTYVVEPVGINWWKGTYKGDSVLVHVIKTKDHATTDIIFLPK